MGFFRKLFGRKRRGDSAVSVDKTAGINLTGSVLRVPKSAFNVTVTPWGLKAETALGATWQHQYGLKTTETKNLKLKEWVVDYILADSDRGMRRGSLNGGLSFNVLRDFDQGSICVFNTWSFHDGETEIVERGGTLYKNWDAERSIGEAVKPESFTVYAGNGEIVGRSNATGEITGGITGKIDYETGFYEIKRDEGFYPEDLRYNAVTQDNLPLDSSIIGIDAVRLPADGRVPVFRKGDMIVISNRLKQDLGSAFTAAQKITLNRQNIDRLCLVDSKGKHVLAEKYTADLKAGSITFAEPLDLSQYTLPLTAVCAWEEENRVTGVDISGRLKLQFAIGRNYPKENTFVSSALIGGDLLVRATEPFSQQAWDNVWSDAQRGEPVLARTNVKDYPIKLAGNGAITERWLIKFVTATQFELYGERLGLVAQSDTLTDLAPTNPATGKPYFTFKAAAFGGGWSVQNCIRFNTYGTPLPVWILRSVQPSPDKQNGRDGFTACLRGNTVAE